MSICPLNWQKFNKCIWEEINETFTGVFGAFMFARWLNGHAETKLTIATVNNGDMIRMQGLTDDFTKAIQTFSWNGSPLKKTFFVKK